MRAIKNPNDILFAATLLLMAGLLYWQISSLRIGTILRMGPGYMPTALCGLIALAGLGILLRSFFRGGDRLHSWPIRPLVFLFAGLLSFGLLVERAGLLVAMPALVVLVSLADRDSSKGEILALAIGLTVFSAGVFVFALRLPIPLWVMG
ncbi:tripartite tricarboxylate transporter TctB family protein [Aquamicrobium terrae]